MIDPSWLDAEDADERISKRQLAKEITLAEASLCRAWREDGYVRARRFLDPDLMDEVWAEQEKVATLVRHPALLYYAKLLLGGDAVPISPVVFRTGIKTPLRREPFLNAFIAIEDVQADAGPMIYYPGSHHAKENHDQAFEAWLKEVGISPRPVVIRKGDAFFWHPNLVYGGMAPKNESLSRRSIVCGYRVEVTPRG